MLRVSCYQASTKKNMKLHTLKIFLLSLGMACLLPVVNAQFDDVYYDPDNDLPVYNNVSDNSDPSYTSPEDVTYYDDDEYAYYDDYDFYYASRIKRFYRPMYGFDFYDPYYVDSYYYDPFSFDSYYPGATIYLSFGNSYYRDYRYWRRWHQWNSYNYFNNWCLTPYNYYYAYNNWCSPHYNYWGGGYNGYYSYSNYYNNYYNSCPFPVSNYNGITHTTINIINSGGTRGSYYGPRITGNTGSSPRGPVHPGSIQPVYADSKVTDNNDHPREIENPSIPTGSHVTNPVTPGTPVRMPAGTPVTDDNISKTTTRDIPVDKELSRDDAKPTPQRPVFRPETDQYKPYPTKEGTNTSPNRPTENKPASNTPSPRESGSYKPTQERPDGAGARPIYQPTPRNNDQPNRSSQYTPRSQEDKPAYNPPVRDNNERPHYTPPQRNHEPIERNAPSYSPPSRQDDSRNEEKPSYSPPQRSNDTGRSNNDSGRGNDRPSYSPPSGNSSNNSGSRSESPRSSSSSSSGGGSPRSGRG
jgi:hypothetical protein